MISIGVVGCSKTKLDRAAPARELYCSTLFRAAFAYAEKTCAHVVIVSAAYGCVPPEMVIEPYDFTIRQVRDRASWARSFSAWLLIELLAKNVIPDDVEDKDVELVLLAGEEYARHIVAESPAWEWSTREPLRGLRIRERIRWLRERTT